MIDRASPEQMTSVRAVLATEAAFADVAPTAPLIVATGQPPHIIHATPAALALFGARSLEEIEARCLRSGEPGARRLDALARTLPADAPPRLERLRFFLDGSATPLTMLCRRTADAEPLFIAAAIGSRASRAAGRQAQQQEPRAEPPLAAADIATGDDAGAPPEPSQEDAKPQRADNVRFLWTTDADHRFAKLNGALCDTLGCETSALLGESFLDLALRPGFDPEGRLQAALRGRETWSGVEVWWPFAHSDEVAPITLGGLPTFARDSEGRRVFTGFSGFGVIRLARVKRVPTQPSVVADDTDENPSDPAAADPEDEAVERADAAALYEDEIAPVAAHEESDPLDEPEKPAPSPIALIRSKLTAGNVVALDAWKSGASQEAERAVERRSRAHDGPQDLSQAGEGATAAIVSGSLNGASPSRAEEAEDSVALSMSERTAFREIARALGARIEGADTPRPERRTVNPTDTDDASAPSQTQSPEVSAPVADAAGLMALATRLVDRIDLGLLVCRGGEAVYLNRPFADMLGYADPEAFLAQDGLRRMFRGRTPEAANAESGDGLLHVLTRGGDTLALDARLQTIDWTDGPATLISMRRSAEPELAARVRALEASLRKREDEASELHAILDTATDGVIVLDSDGRILALNRSAEALFGYEQNEVAGESFSMLFARESQSAAQEYLVGLQGAGVNSLLNDGREVIGRARQGGQMPMFMTLGRIGRDGSRFCAVLRDVTQWKNAERELKDARREAERTSAAKSDFLAKISHEVRTPLNAILGFAEVMGDERFGPLGNERYKDYLKDIHSSGSHVLSLINDLLDLSKIEAGRMDLEFGEVDANEIVSECVSIMQSQAIRERVILRLSLAPRLPHVTADARSLRQIVLNILSNAVKFNQPAGQVIVSTALTDAGAAVIRVRDTGIGMDEREIAMALEPFRQIQTSRQTTGTGLGLPLTKALVEANRAAFTIRSHKGEGTLVEVVFPPSRVSAE